MKHCFYSEKLDKYFDDEDSCLKAESDYDKEQELIKAKKSEVSKRKKELAEAIERAEKELSEAYDNLEVCQADADKIIKDAKESASQIIKKAKETVAEKQKSRLEAISNFNKEFGVYTTTYSGDKALEEIRRFNTLSNSTNWARYLFDLLSNT